MTAFQKLGKEILDHLALYRELGVVWARTGALTKRHAPSKTGTHAASKIESVFIPETRSMFDVPPKSETLESIRDDLGDCQRCKLAPTRSHIVYGSGNANADLMFVGEAPGADEDAQGLPFVGRAGRLLTRIIEAIGMKREEVYICNILKCRPPGNRNPEGEEIAACQPFLLRQIAAVQPKVVCALGSFSAQTLLKTKIPISKLRGQFIDYRGAKLMATFHPAYLLRNPNEKRKVWEDIQKVRDLLNEAPS